MRSEPFELTSPVRLTVNSNSVIFALQLCGDKRLISNIVNVSYSSFHTDIIFQINYLPGVRCELQCPEEVTSIDAPQTLRIPFIVNKRDNHFKGIPVLISYRHNMLRQDKKYAPPKPKTIIRKL